MEYGIHTLVKDYLSSTRLVNNSTGTVEEINNYYPSGALFTVPVPDRIISIQARNLWIMPISVGMTMAHAIMTPY